MKKYFYEGPVTMFNRVVTNHWCGTTCAVSDKKALLNLMYQYKMEYKKNRRATIGLPGKLEIVGVFPEISDDGIQTCMDLNNYKGE